MRGPTPACVYHHHASTTLVIGEVSNTIELGNMCLTVLRGYARGVALV